MLIVVCKYFLWGLEIVELHKAKTTILTCCFILHDNSIDEFAIDAKVAYDHLVSARERQTTNEDLVTWPDVTLTFAAYCLCLCLCLCRLHSRHQHLVQALTHDEQNDIQFPSGTCLR